MNNHILGIVAAVIKRYKIRSVGMLLVITGSILVALIPPLILEKMIDMLSNGSEILLGISFMYLFVFTISGALQSWQNIMITKIGQSITHEIRSVMSQKLKHLPTQYFTSHDTGAVTSRFVNDVDAVDALFTNGIIGMAADTFQIISIFVIIFVKSKGLGILMCMVCPIIFYLTMMFQKRMRTAQINNRKAVAKVTQHVPETIHNIRMIHNNHGEAYMERKYDSYIEAGYRAMNQSNFYDSIYSPIVITISSMVISIMMVCAANGNQMQQLFGITVGSAVAMIAYVGKVFEPIESLGMEIQNIQSALAGVKRINDFLGEDEMQELMEDKSEADSNSCISFHHVKFRYPGGSDIFVNRSFSIQAGENVVFTGRTGAGKSTLFKLLLGLYTPVEGKIFVNHKPVNDISCQDRRKIFGYVEQHFAVVEGTVGDQITLFDPRIGKEDIWRALRQCELYDKISHFPQGIDTPMCAWDFSQGELQLLSIARAIVMEPEIMLLDEITANLDSLTEQRILNTIHAISDGRTVLSISHRMAEKLEYTRVIEI